MADVLPALRSDLELFFSPVAGRSGILIRDPFQYSDAILVVPPLLARCLDCFDGASTQLDLREKLARLTGTVAVGDTASQMARALSEAGFLEDATFAALRDRRRRAFVEADVRPAVHAGGGYPGERGALGRTLTDWLAGEDGAVQGGLPPLAIAAPHVSPIGGPATYGA